MLLALIAVLVCGVVLYIVNRSTVIGEVKLAATVFYVIACAVLARAVFEYFGLKVL